MLSEKQRKYINKLKQKKYRKAYAQFLVEGVKGVTEALNSNTPVVSVIIEGKKRDDASFADIIKKAEKQNIEVVFCGRKDIGDIKTTETFSGVLAIISMPEYDLDDLGQDKPIIVLDGVTDPGNLGTIIRTADWFGVGDILLSEGSVDPYNEKVVRSTMGSIFRTKIILSHDLAQDLEFLKKQGYTVYSLDLSGAPLKNLSLPQRAAYVFGSESHGVSPITQKIVDHSIKIPGKGSAESLNVAVAAGIILSKL